MGLLDAEFHQRILKLEQGLRDMERGLRDAVEILSGRVAALEERAGHGGLGGSLFCDHLKPLRECSECCRHEDGAAEAIWERAMARSQGVLGRALAELAERVKHLEGGFVAPDQRHRKGDVGRRP